MYTYFVVEQNDTFHKHFSRPKAWYHTRGLKKNNKRLSIIYVADHLLSVMKGPLCLVLVAQNQLMAKTSFAQTNQPHNPRN